MEEYKLTLGLGITGSFCTFGKILRTTEALVQKGIKVIPVYSRHAGTLDTRFMTAEAFQNRMEALTGEKGIKSIVQAEPIGPSGLFDVMAIAPCTGNTMAKLQQGIVDTTVLMAAKAHLRNEKPLVLAISTNDALSMNLRNIGLLMNMKHIYFVPFRQDDYQKKPHSLVADFSRLEETIAAAMKEKQLQPVVLSPMPVDYK